MTRGIFVSSPGKEQQSSGTTTCLMGKVRAYGQARMSLKVASPYPCPVCHLGGLFLAALQMVFDLPNIF